MNVKLLDEIIGHLGSAKVQRAQSDDKIIAGHIDAAYDAATKLRGTLGEIIECLDQYADVEDGDYGHPAPNRAMTLLSELERGL